MIIPDDDTGTLQLLGMRLHHCGILFVEDRTSQCMLSEILAKFRPSLLSMFAIVKKGAASDVIRVLGEIPERGHPLRFAGILDGDQRQLNRRSSWPVFFLPTDRAPDNVLFDHVNANRPELAAQLNRSVNEINTALDGNYGANPHDWFEDVARHLSFSVEELIRICMRCWMSDPSHEEECRKLVGEIESLVSDEL